MINHTLYHQSIAQYQIQIQNTHFLILTAMCVGMAVLFGLAIPFFNYFILALIVSVMLLTWTMADFRVGVVLVLVLIHISGTVFIPRELAGIQGLNPINLLILGSALSYVVYRSREGNLALPWTPSLFLWYLLPFMVATLFGATKTDQIPQQFETLKLVSFNSGFGYFRDMFIKPCFAIIGSFLLALAIREATNPARYIHIISAGCLFLASSVLGAFISSGASLGMLSGSNARGFLSVLGMHANEISLCLNLGYTLLLFSLIGQKSGSKKITFLVLPFISTAILMTFSRAGIAAFLFINACYLIRRRHLGALIGFSIIGLLLGSIFYEPIMDRLATGVSTGNRAEITAGRLDQIWLPLLDDLSLAWLLPHGPSAIMWSKPLLDGRMLFAGHTHSAYLGLIYDYGFIFGTLIIGFLIHLFNEFRRRAQTDSDPALRHLFEGACVALVVIALQGISDDRFTPTIAQTPFWCAVGILIGRGGLGSAKSISTTREPISELGKR